MKCCLRYEDETYTDLKKRLPKKNTKVKTKHGQGKVVDTQILTQLVMIEYQSGERIAAPVEEIEIIPASQSTKEEKEKPPKNNKQKTRKKKEQ